MEVSDEQFDALITRAMDELPQDDIRGLKNVVIVMADEPTPEQRGKMHDNAHLLGLFEGVPLTDRGSGWSGMLPDKITLFKKPLLSISRSAEEFYEETKRALWHEIAHYYGIEEDRLHELGWG